ncbi:MAG: ABC transporter substrate-binding protein, partial [Halobacteriales archaeon]|nr:ABC transporter substrate-binding protein [Halobacteriales archaeon]
MASLVLATMLAGCSGGSEPGALRLGYFPNITHAQPLYGVQSGLYAEKMAGVKLTTMTFNAGPEAFQALLSNSVDVIYVGPSPILNALDHGGNDIVRIVAGSAMGGASFVVRPGVMLEPDSALAGKTFATPQEGNTQDIALKHWLRQHG